MAAHYQRLSGQDASFLAFEGPTTPMNVGGASIFEAQSLMTPEGGIDIERIKHYVASQMHLIPRYRQVVKEPPFHIGYPTWEDDPHFDIRRHIIRVSVDPPGGEAELEVLAGRLLSQLMDRGKPLWDVYVIDGLKDGRGALLVRLHHSMADGISGASLMKVLMDPAALAGARQRYYRVSISR